MNSILVKIKNNCISGVLFLLPFLILLILLQKVFGYFNKFGGGIAKMMGLDQLFGVHTADFFGTLILFSFVFVSGFLVRLAFFKKISDEIDTKLMEIIPGYEKHKELAKKKLVEKQKTETDLPILIKFGDYWRPGFLIEKDEQENAVVIISEFEGNKIYIVPFQNIKILKETTLSAFKASIKASGKGLLACK